MNNKHRYTLLRISRVLLAPFYSILSLFLKKNGNVIITASLNNEFSDNAKALFEYLIVHDQYQDRVYFVLNDDKKRADLNILYPGKFISNTNMKDALFILRAKYWYCSAMELPLAVFFQRHIRHVVHLGHGMLYKRIGLLERNSSWYKKLYYKLVTSSFSYTIATTEFCKNSIAQGFGMPDSRVVLTPQPKTLTISSSKPISNYEKFNADSMHILYAPTWRPYAQVKLFPFDDLDLEGFNEFLKEYKIHIWLRVHPRFEQDIDKALLLCENIHLFSAKEYEDINPYLSNFHALISDYSSIYYDFLTLERPVLFFDYDFEKYNSLVGVIDGYERVKCTKTTESYKQFLSQLIEIKNNEFDLSSIHIINCLVNYSVDSGVATKIMLKRLGL